MADYNQVFKLIKNANLTLTDDDIVKLMGQPKKPHEKVYTMSDVGTYARKAAKVAEKKRRFFTKSAEAEDDTDLEDENGRCGVSFDRLFPWLESLAKDQKYPIDKEKVRKVLAGNAYRALRITDSFFNPAVRAYAQQIIRGQK